MSRTKSYCRFQCHSRVHIVSLTYNNIYYTFGVCLCVCVSVSVSVSVSICVSVCLYKCVQLHVSVYRKPPRPCYTIIVIIVVVGRYIIIDILYEHTAKRDSNAFLLFLWRVDRPFERSQFPRLVISDNWRWSWCPNCTLFNA